MLKHVTMRVEKIGLPHVVAMPEMYECPENDVLARYWLASGGYDGIMRITADCPLLAPEQCRRVLEVFKSGHYDLVGTGPTYPDGMGCEVFTREALTAAYQEAEKPYDREHVTPYIRNRSRDFNLLYLRCPFHGRGDLKLSVDTPSDLEYARKVDAAGPHGYSLEATLEAVDRVKP